MTTERPTRDIEATVTAIGEWRDKPNISLQISAFGSDYPTVVNDWPEGLRETLQVGANYKFRMERQGLKKGKSGSRDWDYFWGIQAVLDGSAGPAPVGRPPSQGEGRQREASTATPDRQDLIMLQHASGVVAHAYGDWNRLHSETRGTFSDYLKAIAQGATWYLKNVYQPGGYHPIRSYVEPPGASEEPPEEDMPF
tara:strand:+ start:626 stop:1213 length:588 start_codon:yes stop_codon:yes gene_type:complete